MKHLTPIQAIKQKCKNDCCAGDMSSWKECKITNCALYPYRLGVRPSNERKHIDSTPKTPTNTHCNMHVLNKESPGIPGDLQSDNKLNYMGEKQNE